MTFLELREAVRQLLASANLGLETVFDDMAYKPDGDQEFMRVSVRHAANGKASLSDHIGRRVYARSGTIYVQLFTKIGGAVNRGYELSQNVINVFENAKLDNLRFEKIFPQEVGADGNYYQVNVLAEFYYEDIH